MVTRVYFRDSEATEGVENAEVEDIEISLNSDFDPDSVFEIRNSVISSDKTLKFVNRGPSSSPMVKSINSTLIMNDSTAPLFFGWDRT